jgi:hypothetical protein
VKTRDLSVSLGAQHNLEKFRVYKVVNHKKIQYGSWRVAYMGFIIARKTSWEEAMKSLYSEIRLATNNTNTPWWMYGPDRRKGRVV